MPPRILLIDHHDNPPDDLATLYLTQSGCKTERICPFRGDALPQVGDDIAGAVVYGGSQNVTELDQFPYLATELDWIGQALSADIPLLGICLGAQLMAHQLGAWVGFDPQGRCEFGYYPVRPTAEAGEFLTAPIHFVHAHFQVFDLPAGATLLATGDEFRNQAFRYGRHAYGVQFHPEVSPAIFSRWQAADWAPAFYQTPGAQTPKQQNHYKHRTAPEQAQWFERFLARLFVAG